MPKTDPVIDALRQLGATAGGNLMKIDAHFGDRPDVLDAIRAARTEQRASYSGIGRTLTAACGQRIGDGAVKTWLAAQGID